MNWMVECIRTTSSGISRSGRTAARSISSNSMFAASGEDCSICKAKADSFSTSLSASTMAGRTRSTTEVDIKQLQGHDKFFAHREESILLENHEGSGMTSHALSLL